MWKFAIRDEGIVSRVRIEEWMKFQILVSGWLSRRIIDRASARNSAIVDLTGSRRRFARGASGRTCPMV